MTHGFLPTRGSWTLDLVAVMMVAVVVVLAYSIYVVRYRRNFRLHRNLQVATAIALGLALVAFEIDIRFFTDWRELAKPSVYYDSGWVNWILGIHLCLAIPTPIVWGIVTWVALRRFKDSFEQGSFNRTHQFWGRVGAAMMFGTAITGWVFYCVAFVA